MTNVERARELTEQIKANIWTGNMEPMILAALNEAVKEKDKLPDNDKPFVMDWKRARELYNKLIAKYPDLKD